MLDDEGLVRLGPLDGRVQGIDEVLLAARDFTPEAVADACGVPAERIRELARELATTERAVVYGRIGLCNQEFGTLASWAVDVVNVLTGHLDVEGGAMFPTPGDRHDLADGAPAGSGQDRALAHARAPAPPRCSGRRRSRAWRRRSPRRARAGSARSSPSPATRCCRRPTPAGSTTPSRCSTR